MGSPTRHLFFDDWEIERLGGARRRWHSLRKQPEPILKPQAPWEGKIIYAYGGSLLDNFSGTGYRLYYTAMGHGLGKRSYVCLAESTDGVRFDRPKMGNFEFEGDTDNNIVFVSPDEQLASLSVVWDGADTDVRRRMKMIYTVEGETPYDCMMRAACSQDGLKFATVSIGAATLRRDGFVSLTAADEEVEVLTKVLGGEPRSELWVNASVARDGFLACEVTSPDGKALSGSSLKDCIPLQTDSTVHRLQWRRQDRGAWPDALRLRFRMKRAELFSFWFA
ncbi:MAG: hypothetical protein SVV80_09115 [Planctomycetota bacterium]|nr:hypothetical protein [Planctomycetota bacterium]